MSEASSSGRESVPRHAPAWHRSLGPATAAALRRVLREAAAGDASDEEIASIARFIALGARTHGLLAEQMIVLVKEEWSGLSSAHIPVPAVAARELRTRLISHCIHEYHSWGARRPR